MSELGIIMSEGNLTVCADAYTLMSLKATIDGLLKASLGGKEEDLIISRSFKGSGQPVEVTFKMVD